MSKFTRQQRLLTIQDFNTVFQASKKISLNGIVLLYRNNDFGFARLGLAISKKYVPKAVRRNQIKRIIRENFRLMAQDLADLDIVIMVRSKLPPKSEELHRILRELFGQMINHDS